ncbi:MAG: argininosuccinate lyase, partial [Muribaculaceae bacterium]|nr:argininosuccinate lyase [Muribaculaceae bacterium]
SIPNELALLTANLPLGYNRDYQLMKDVLFPATTEILNCLNMAAFMLDHIQVNDDILNDPKYDYLFTVEDVNRLVLSGVPFREAYRTIGMQVQSGEYKPTRSVHHTHLGSIGNLANDLIANKMNEALRPLNL